MINLSNWLMGLMSFFTPTFDSVVSAVAGPVIGNLMGGDSGGTQGYQQPVPQFTPYNITTPYGSSTFDTAKKTASYTLSPEMQAFRDQYYAGAKAALPSQAQTQFANQVGQYGLGLFNQAANLDTNQMAQDYYNQQQAMLAPGRAQQQSSLADTLFKTGRTGAGAGMTTVGGQQGYVNPEQFSLLAAQEGQNAQLQMGAEDRARAIQNAQLAQGLNLYGQGQGLLTQPYATSAGILGYGTNLEGLGQNALTIGSNIGSMQANALNQAANTGIAQQNALNLNNAQQASMWGGLASNVGNTVSNAVKNNGGWANMFSGIYNNGGVPQNTPSFDQYYNMSSMA